MLSTDLQTPGIESRLQRSEAHDKKWLMLCGWEAEMDVHVLSLFYLLPLLISAVGAVIEFRRCTFTTAKHALGKAFFLAFRSLVPVLNILSALLYLMHAGLSLWKNQA